MEQATLIHKAVENLRSFQNGTESLLVEKSLKFIEVVNETFAWLNLKFVGKLLHNIILSCGKQGMIVFLIVNL